MKINAIICGLAVCFTPTMVVSETVLTFPESATRKLELVKDASSYQLPLSAFSGGSMITTTAEGQVKQAVWRTIGGQTETLDLLTPLRTQLQEAGFNILFECETRNCGGFDFRFNTPVIEEPDMHVDLSDFRFLSAEKIDGEQAERISLLVSRSADQGYIQVTTVNSHPVDPVSIVLSSKQPDGNLVTTDGPSSLAVFLVENGSIVLDGLVFAKGASDLSVEHVDSLQELARFLSDNPLQSVVLVGHTDASGSLSGNVVLSRKRANSVMQRMVNEHGIDPVRLSAEGIGYLAPRASNDTEIGRELNRRVEVVLTPAG